MSDMSINNYTGSLYDVYNSSKTSSGSKLQQTLSDKDMSDVSEDELMNVCKEFEAYFAEQVFKSMQKTVTMWNQDEQGSASQYKEYATDTLIQEYATSASERGGGLGLAKMLYEQMKVNYNL